jgi:hypothetical protein
LRLFRRFFAGGETADDEEEDAKVSAVDHEKIEGCYYCK